MNYALGQETSCNGDSGSGIVIKGNVGDGIPRTILGVVLGGDFNCRANQANLWCLTP